MSSIGPNAKFLNHFFGAQIATRPSSESEEDMSQDQARKELAQTFIAQRFQEVSRAVHFNKIQLDKNSDEQINTLRKQLDIFGYLRILFKYSAKIFKDKFSGFTEHIKNEKNSSLTRIANSNLRTPLPKMIQAGVDSAAHLWEMIIKSIFIKRKSNLTADEFRKAVEKSQDLLLDLTDIPLSIFIILESILWKRNDKNYSNLGMNGLQRERLGRDILHEAIDYNSSTNQTNLDQNFINNDNYFRDIQKQVKKGLSENDLTVVGCAGKQIIPIYVKFMQNMFEQYLMPHFHELISLTNFELS
jgi:hypothetical protein